MPDLNHVKIAYVFEEHRHPEKDFENTMDAIQEFLVDMLGQISPEKWEKNKAKLVYTFTSKYLKHELEDESEALKRVIFHPQSIEEIQNRLLQLQM